MNPVSAISPEANALTSGGCGMAICCVAVTLRYVV
jgi:hypothetical protein